MLTNKYCIPSKSRHNSYKIICYLLFCNALKTKIQIMNLFFNFCLVFLLKQVLYLQSQSIKYPYDNKCFRKSTNPLNHSLVVL